MYFNRLIDNLQTKTNDMKLRLTLYGLLLMSLWACRNTPAEDPSPPAAVVLFTEGADDWSARGNADWTFEDGAIVGKLDTGQGFLVTKKSYGDFELTLEFNPDSTVNSGIFSRCQKQELSPETCFEFNIWDLHPNQDFRTGAVVTRAKPLAYIETLNKWNTYRIRCQGDHIESWINDTKVADLQDGSLEAGYIILQAAGSGTIKFRKVELQELE